MRRVFPFTFIPSHKSDGTVNVAGTVWFYTAGTSTLEPTFADFSLSATNSISGVTLDSAGKARIFLKEDRLYDIVEKDSAGNTVNTHYMIGQNLSAVLTDLNQNLISNNSFETDANADNVPDNWTLAAASGATLTRDTADSDHGVASMKMVSAGASGSGTATSTIFECSPSTNYVLAFDIKSSVANVNPKVQVEWLDRAQASISTSTIFNISSSVPTDWTRKQGMTVTSPALAVYAKVILTGSANTVAGTTRFDNISFVQESTTVSPWGKRGLYVTNGTDTDHDIDIAAGEVRDSTNTYNLILTAAITKQIDAAWAVGSAAGGLDTGAIGADTIYAVYLIGNPTTGVVDVLASTSFTSPTLPSGYTKYRRIWAFLTDSSNNIRNWIDPISNYHRLLDPFNDVLDSTITSGTFETVTASCPPSSLWHIYGRTYNATNESRGISIRTYGTQDIAPSAGAQESFIFCRNGATTDTGITAQGFVLVDADRKAEYAVEENGGTNVASIVTFGWLDLGIG